MIVTLGSAAVINATKDAAQDILPADLTMEDGREFDYWEILIEIATSVIVNYTRNGTAFKALDKKVALESDTGYLFQIPATPEDTFNLQLASGSGIACTGLVRGIKDKN